MHTVTPTPLRSKRSINAPYRMVKIYPPGTPVHKLIIPSRILMDGNDSIPPSNYVPGSPPQADSPSEEELTITVDSEYVTDNINTSYV